jgi:selenocysteine-specific elongation factor
MRVVATAGHVDHGKSALLRAITGMEPDRWEEERRRGLTIDLGYVWADLPAPDEQVLTVAFVDVPGHASYLQNMLVGVGVVDQALLVVAADDGWSAQSQEHLEILGLLGVRIIAVAVTKVDLVESARIEAVRDDVLRRLRAAGFVEPPVIGVAALNGEGIEVLRGVIADRLLSSERPVEEPATLMRLRVDRAFRIRGAGSVVTGMLESGTLMVGQDVVVLPSGVVGHVRSLQQLGSRVERAERGARVAVDLGRVDHEVLVRGVVVAEGPQPKGRPTRCLEVELRTLDRCSVGETGAWHLHIGTSFSAARVAPIFGEIGAGSSGVVRLELDREVVAWVGDRFVLRDAGRDWTVAGGTVLDPLPLPHRRGTEQRFAHALVLEELARSTTSHSQVEGLVDAHGGVRAVRDVEDALGRHVVDLDTVVRVADALVRVELLAHWVDAVLVAAAGLPSEHAVDAARLVRAAEAAGCPTDLVRPTLGIAVERGGLVNFGGRFVHSDHVEDYRRRRAQRQALLLDALDATPLEPPDPAGPIAGAEIPSFEVQELIDDGRLVACGPLFFTAGAVAEAVQRLLDGPGASGAPFSASDARQAWGTTRRCAVPLLEHLQSKGLTTFNGSEHRLRAE